MFFSFFSIVVSLSVSRVGLQVSETNLDKFIVDLLHRVKSKICNANQFALVKKDCSVQTLSCFVAVSFKRIETSLRWIFEEFLKVKDYKNSFRGAIRGIKNIMHFM